MALLSMKDKSKTLNCSLISFHPWNYFPFNKGCLYEKAFKTPVHLQPDFIPSWVPSQTSVSSCPLYMFTLVSYTPLKLTPSKLAPQDFPGGPVVKNSPSNARDAGSIPKPMHHSY